MATDDVIITRTSTWVRSGEYATGPTTRIESGPVTIDARAVWVDDDDITVVLDTNDTPIPAGLIETVCTELRLLAKGGGKPVPPSGRLDVDALRVV